MYKSLGLSSEEVCEIGKWKNVQAFSQHYLRIGAHKVASQKILPFLVHKVSPLRSAKPDLTCTPGKTLDPGGNVREGEAQAHGEPTPLPREVGPYNWACQNDFEGEEKEIEAPRPHHHPKATNLLNLPPFFHIWLMNLL
jgi:hypothetical protein